ncbi:major facilitator superfamily domain-containing protein [Hyaloraphidium curvatum]|nr:major facilitator superfamily domain-containing protein [Hyaloraphidium curvatum]
MGGPAADPGAAPPKDLRGYAAHLAGGCVPAPRTPLRIVSLFFLAILLGCSDAGWGVVLPFFRDTFGLTNSTASLNFICGVAGFVLASLSNGAVLAHLGVDAGLYIGSLLSAVAYSLLAGALPFGACLFAFFVLGAGSGLQDAGANIVSVRFPVVGNLVLNFFHALYGIGALLGPPIATAIVLVRPWNFVYVVWAALQVFSLGPIPTDTVRTAKSRAETTKAAATDFARMVRMPLVWIAALHLLFYVGGEVTVGSWAFSFLTEVRGGSTAESGPLVSCYWGGLVASRLFFMPLTDRMGDRVAGLVYLGVSTAALAVLWAVPSIPVNAAMLFFVGLGYGPLYPLAITLVSRAFDQRDPADASLFATAMGFLVALASLGAAFFPWFTGAMSQLADPDGSGVWVFAPIAIGLNVVVAVLYVAMVASVARRKKEREAARGAAEAADKAADEGT